MENLRDAQPSASAVVSVSPLPRAPAAEAAEDSTRNTVPFADMEYVRPDTDAMAARIDEIASEIDQYENLEELEAAMDEVDEIFYEFQSMGILAIIYSLTDKNDAAWVAEELYVTQTQSVISKSIMDLYQTLHSSSFREEIESEWDPAYFENIEDMDFITDETQPLYEREAEIVNKYNETFATASIPYNGAQYTYGDILNVADYDTYIGALAEWYATYNPLLGEMYVELINIRNAIAAALGYEDYFDMVFNSVHSDYSSDMVEAYLGDIAAYTAPLYQQITLQKAYGNPAVNTDYGTFYDMLRDILYNLSEDFVEPLDYMTQYDLCSYEPAEGKQPGGYTLYIDKYDAPYMICSYTGDLGSMNTFIHEFGHFYDNYINWSAGAAAIDTQEIFSQALELLVSNYFTRYYGDETGYLMQYNALASAFTTFPEQALYTSFEMRAYRFPQGELTVDILNRIYREECEKFGTDMIPARDHMISRYGWVAMQHIFGTPFYTLSYVTSQDVALQIWELSLEDEQAAVDAYIALASSEKTDFIRDVEAAGLTSPFAPGRMAGLADWAADALLPSGADIAGAAA